MREILTKYPKATKVVKDYYLGELIKGLKADLPEDFKEHVREKGIEDETLSQLMLLNPRAIFSVFDENKLVISINFLALDGEGWFIWNINDWVSTTADGFKYKTRLEAEIEAVKEAFSILESKLENEQKELSKSG